MGSEKANISEGELDVLKVLWERGPSTVREVNEQLPRRRKWAYNTVLTLLTRLRDKGYVTSKKGGQSHIFDAAVSQSQLLRQRAGELADQLCDGAASPLVHALVQGARFTPDEIQQFRNLLDELEQETKQPTRKKKKKKS